MIGDVLLCFTVRLSMKSLGQMPDTQPYCIT